MDADIAAGAEAIMIGIYNFIKEAFMPGNDGTGPLGLGSMTGRGLGVCAVPLSENEANVAVYGRGRGGLPFGCGRGRGFGGGRNQFARGVNGFGKVNNTENLELLEKQKETIEKMISTIEKNKADEEK
jgi:hypothetical protein